MKNYKKIIAREFLYLLSGVLIMLCFVLIFSKCEKSLKEKKESLVTLKESDTSAYRLNFYYRTQKISQSNNENDKKYIEEVSELTKFPNIKEFIKNVKNPKIYISIWNSASKYYDIDRSKDKKYENKIKNDKNYSEILLSKIEKLEKEISENENSFFYSSSNLEMIIILIISSLFFLRYITYATIWSVKQVRQ
jgi:hypothetical protein